MLAFLISDSRIFVAGVFGALASMAFCGVRPWSRADTNIHTLLMTSCGYLLTAGYLATILPGVSKPFEAFLAGLATDILIRGLRRAAFDLFVVNSNDISKQESSEVDIANE